MKLKQEYVQKLEQKKVELNEISQKLYEQSIDIENIAEEFSNYKSTQNESKVLYTIVELVDKIVDDIDSCGDKIDLAISEIKKKK